MCKEFIPYPSMQTTWHLQVINISSPNTPGLRKLQGRKQLKDLVKKVQAARDEMQWADDGPPPLLVKIAPDLDKQDLEDIAAVSLALRLDGLIMSNTNISRPDAVNKHPVARETGGLSGKPLFDLSNSILRKMYILTRIMSNTNISRPDAVNKHPVARETGGLSGKPLFDLSNSILRKMYILTRGRIPLIGCVGVSSGEDAYRKIRAGATLVQLYTAFAYGGPALIPQLSFRW
ncbi:putative dihydroorotate dehydrogenase (quinone), mitochondrial [Iris pallida]|uniref:Dihydroorotate dehydrogenase (Quinone), mitochondrial n=1 Tax=Iris pallida TaxID=29817 RepID=A0AAX6ETX0_IRIPA|nr:putative dihydroorotate dehydrogenase (quinone), mitochondrial [Iris pallida]